MAKKFLDYAGLEYFVDRLKNRDVNGQGLSSNDYTNADKAKLDSVAHAADDTMALVVKLHAAINASVSPTTVFKGEDAKVTINHSASFDGKPLTYTVSVDDAPLSNPYTVNDNKTFNVKFDIDNAEPALTTSITKQVRVSAYYPRYYGRVDKATLTSADILALEKQPVSASAAMNNKTITSTASDYLWLCVPSGMTVKSVTSGGFAVPMEAPVTVAVEGKGSYLCYRSSAKANAGSVTYNIQ